MSRPLGAPWGEPLGATIGPNAGAGKQVPFGPVQTLPAHG